MIHGSNNKIYNFSSRSNFTVNFGVRKLESRGYHVALFA